MTKKMNLLIGLAIAATMMLPMTSRLIAPRRRERQELYDGGVGNETQTVRTCEKAHDRSAEPSRAADGERVPDAVSHGKTTDSE